MELLEKLFHTLLHLSPETINDLATFVGVWVYVILFAIVFCETGLVATPFLPGDSLLFAVGAVAAFENSPIDITLIAVLLCVAAIIGDAINYSIGRRLGPMVFHREDSWLLNKKHLLEAHDFYERYGGKTILLARFVPIVRTFAPFVAGIGQMSYVRFALFNVTGGLVWVLGFLFAGYGFGLKLQSHFKLIIAAILFLSLLPIAIELWRAKRAATRKQASSPAA